MGLEIVEDDELGKECYLFANDEKYGPKMEIPYAFVTHVQLGAAGTEKRKCDDCRAMEDLLLPQYGHCLE